MKLIGINEGINSSVVVLDQGRVIFALQEERVNRDKNYMGFPHNALNFTLKYLSLNPSDIHRICLSNLQSPIVSKSSFLKSYDLVANEAYSQSIFRKLKQNAPKILKSVKKKINDVHQNEIIDGHLLSHGFLKNQIVRSHHHLNHGASAYYGLRKNPEERHLVLTLDGGGDDSCSHVYVAQHNEMRLIAQTPLGHSIGNLYSRITHFLGMTPHDHEYKVMGLSAYCDDMHYIEPILKKLSQYVGLDKQNPLQFYSPLPEKTYACQKRIGKDFLRTRFDNLAGGIQKFTEDLLVQWVRETVKKTGIRKVVAAGGVFMNVKANRLLALLPEIEYIDIFPSCGDETLPFGSVWHYYANHSNSKGDDIVFDSFSLGPDVTYDFEEAKKIYQGQFSFEKVDNVQQATANLLAQGHIVAYCSGPMEFGARALGNRSIIADPANAQIVTEINKMIKHRDFWMPFAPAVLFERFGDYVIIPKSLPQNRLSPYMMQTFESTGRFQEMISAVHPYDKTARAQTVLKDIHPNFHKIISEFENLTQKGVVLNTSYNLHGEPLVMGSVDAIKTMKQTTLKYLVLENWIVSRNS